MVDRELIAQSGRIGFRPTSERDLGFVLQTERDPENVHLVGQSTEEEHRAAFRDKDKAHWIIEDDSDGRSIGYIILAGLRNSHANLELRRIVISERGCGFGREALRLLKKLAFERLGAHRLWLDVFDYNTVARNLYRSGGFVEEGILRQCYRMGDQYESLIVMSLLVSEHRP